MTVRTDGVGCLDVRFTIETHDGALIYATHSGTMHLGDDGYEKFLRRELPSTIPLQVVGNYRTAHPVYKWINRVQCMGVGSAFVQEGQVQYDNYAIR